MSINIHNRASNRYINRASNKIRWSFTTYIFQPERKHKTLKRQDSIQKILEDQSRRFHRRHRSNSDEKPDVHVCWHIIN